VFKKALAAAALCSAIFIASSFAVSGIDKKKREDTLKQVELFSDALVLVQNEYVDEAPAKNLIYGALKGMVAGLDPHSQFLDPDDYNELKVDTEGKFGGVGIEISVKDGVLTIVTPIDGTPAWKAGIKAGDKIVRIDNALTRDFTLSDAVKRMRGEPGKAVDITVWRESEKKVLEFRIVRDTIKIKDLKDARVLEDGIAYIRLVEFRENTPDDFNKALVKLSGEGMNALVIDLRNNPGGLLEVAVKVAENFIEEGKLVISTKSRNPSQNLQFFSRQHKPFLDMPVAVLINEGSASGSEIVAGCLQDYKRAVIVGKRSFGKGFVQTVIPLNDGSALKLTTSRYLTPLGRQIEGTGIIPDIEVEAFAKKAKDQPVEAGPDDVFEQLEAKPGEKPEKESAAAAEEYKSDNQLVAAIDALKAIKIYRQFPKGK